MISKYLVLWFSNLVIMASVEWCIPALIGWKWEMPVLFLFSCLWNKKSLDVRLKKFPKSRSRFSERMHRRSAPLLKSNPRKKWCCEYSYCCYSSLKREYLPCLAPFVNESCAFIDLQWRVGCPRIDIPKNVPATTQETRMDSQCANFDLLQQHILFRALRSWFIT